MYAALGASVALPALPSAPPSSVPQAPASPPSLMRVIFSTIASSLFRSAVAPEKVRACSTHLFLDHILPSACPHRPPPFPPLQAHAPTVGCISSNEIGFAPSVRITKLLESSLDYSSTVLVVNMPCPLLFSFSPCSG